MEKGLPKKGKREQNPASGQAVPEIVPLPTIQFGKYIIDRIFRGVFRRVVCQLWRKISLRLNAVLVHRTKLKTNIQKEHIFHVT